MRREPTPQAIGARIQAVRKEQGRSPEYLAALLNVSRDTIERWERGETEPSYRIVAIIAHAFDKPVGWFVGEKQRVA